MTPIVIFGILIVAGIGALIALRMKWNKASNDLAKVRAKRIEAERIAVAAKSEDTKKS